MRKRFADFRRSLWLAKCTVALLVSMGVFLAGPSMGLAQAADTTQKPKTGIALPGEKCRVPPLKEWTEPEGWAWVEICEGRIADFNQRLGERLDPRDPVHGDLWLEYYYWADGRRTLSSSFLSTILLYEPFRSAIPHRGVWIIRAYFKDEIDLRDASIERPLVLDYSLFKSPVNMRRFTTTKFVSFIRSRFEGKLDMDSATIGGNLFIHHAHFKEVRLVGLTVGGQLAMDGSKFKGKLNMNAASIGGSLFMRGKAKFEKNVDLRIANIRGDLQMNGSRFDCNLEMDSTSIGESLHMRNAQFKEVDLRVSKVGGQLSMIGSKFKGKLNMNSASIGRSLLMSNAQFKEVDLAVSHVEDQLEMSGSTFEGKLNMDSASVGNNLFMRKATFNKPVQFLFLHVGSILDARGATLSGLDLSGTQIEGELLFGLGEGGKKTEWKGSFPKFTLRNARVGALQDTEDSWPDNLEREFEGFIYQRLGGLGMNEKETPYERSSEWFIDWLAKDKTYSPQPYLQLAGVLRTAGYEYKADDVLYASRERELRDSKTSPRKWRVLSVLKVTIGYGYGFRYFRLLYWVLGLLVIGTFLLFINLEKDNDGKKIGFWYSLDMLLPVIKLREKHYKMDLQTPVKYYFYFHQIMGYLLIFFLIAGLSGIME